MALADGKVLPPVAIAVPPQTASQRALLHYRQGTERLVIETSFTGEGTNFAWVVPLPAMPRVEAVSPDLLDVLASSFWPKLVARPAYWWVFYAVGAAKSTHRLPGTERTRRAASLRHAVAHLRNGHASTVSETQRAGPIATRGCIVSRTPLTVMPAIEFLTP